MTGEMAVNSTPSASASSRAAASSVAWRSPRFAPNEMTAGCSMSRFMTLMPHARA